MRTPIAGLVLALVTAGAATAQDLEPRAYSSSPVGTTFLIVSATRSAGGVFTDPSLPIDDVSATIGVLGLGVGHTFAIAGRQALLLGAIPVAWGEASGRVGEDRQEVSRRGLADARVRLSVILAGSRALPPADFARAPRRTVLGASVTVVPPNGQYDSRKLVNLGSNRWAFKSEVGVSRPSGRWTLEGYAGAWFFTTNDEFYPGSLRREQDPIFGVQGHVSYTFPNRSWVAFNGTWYTGGRTTIDNVDKADLQRNTRIGATFSQPIGRRQSLKVSYSAGATTRIGADFRTVSAAWQMVVF